MQSTKMPDSFLLVGDPDKSGLESLIFFVYTRGPAHSVGNE